MFKLLRHLKSFPYGEFVRPLLKSFVKAASKPGALKFKLSIHPMLKNLKALRSLAIPLVTQPLIPSFEPTFKVPPLR